MLLYKEKFFSLEGKWVLKRSTNGFGEMTGVASFVPFPNTVSSFFYREDGIFVIPNESPFSFYREYIYCFNRGIIEIYFSSGHKKQGLFLSLTSAPFKSLTSAPFKDCSLTGTHQCGQDTYTATYAFLDNNTFTLHYDINGPKKDLVLHTVFKRED